MKGNTVALDNGITAVHYFDLNNNDPDAHTYYESTNLSSATIYKEDSYDMYAFDSIYLNQYDIDFNSIELFSATGNPDHIFATNADEIIYAEAGDDVVYGYGGNDELYGEGGNDTLNGGEGADVLDGGSGFDIAGYDDAAAGVTVNLASTRRNTGEATGDEYISIEGLSGSQHNDSLFGDDNDNLLLGNGGDDTIYGKGGNDTLNGGAGNDKLCGDGGDDIYLFVDFFAGDADVIAESNGSDTLTVEFAYDQLDASLSNNHLLLTFQVGSESSSITVNNWNYGDTYQIEEFIFGENTYNADQFLLDNYGIA